MMEKFSIRYFLLALGLLIGLTQQAFSQTPDSLNNLTSAGVLADTDTFAICQTSTGCVAGTATPLKKGTGLQLKNYIGTVGYLINPNVALTGIPTAPTAAQSVATASTQIATVAFVKAQQPPPPTVSWVVGGTPAGGVLLGRVGQALTVTGIWCRPTVSGDSGNTIDVYTAPSGTGGTSGTKLTTSSCNPAGTVNADQNLLSSGTPAIPANNTVYLVTGGIFANSAGSVNLQITTP